MQRRSYPLYHIDAFTTEKLGGNPCVVVMDADSLSTEQMQRVAKEMNLSETAFVIESGKADFGARYFTPAEEIPMAGHPTLSTIAALIARGAIDPQKTDHIMLELKAGLFPVQISMDNEDLLITMTQKKPEFLRVYDKVQIAAIFGLSPDDIMESVPVQTVSTGTGQLMIPVKSAEVLNHLDVHVSELIKLHGQGDFFSVHLFSVSSPYGGDTWARHFAPPPDIFEDPFTGSATGGMGAYLWHYGLMKKTTFLADQGQSMGRPGRGLVTLIGKSEAIEGVQVGGNAVLLYRGEMEL